MKQYKNNDLYSIFNEVLVSDYSLDWFQVFDDYLNLGNYSGIYPDSCLMLMKIVEKTAEIKRVVELGCGVSTLFLKRICDLRGCSFVSYEEREEYRDITKSLLRKYKTDDACVEKYPGIQNLDFSGVDMIFIDHSQSERINILKNSESIMNVPIVLLDNFGSLELSIAFCEFLRRLKSPRPFCVYNGVGREDRQQAVTWDQDFVGSIRDMINSNVIRIGIS